MSRTIWLCVFLLTLGLCVACEGEKNPQPTPDVADAGEAAPKAASDASAAAPEADAAKADPKVEEAAPKKDDGPGLLPSPDFNLKPPGLKVPGDPKKRGILGGEQGGGEKPRLLDVDLNKEK